MSDLFSIPILAFLASLVMTPVVRRLAEYFGIVDRPDLHRKIHEKAVPLCGGVALLFAVLVAVGAATALPNALTAELVDHRTSMLGLLAAALVLCVVGIIDDWMSLTGKQKLLGQSVAVSILIWSGFTIESVRIFGWDLNLAGFLWLPLTYVWLLGAINSLNLIDGVDGLATTVGIILCSTLSMMALHNGYPVEAVLALAMVGALVGFLYFNFPPATIFLGDAGSMLIGLTAGALAIRCSLKGPATVSLAAPLAVWAIPFFDTAVAILRRKLTGRSIYTTDRGHLHHCVLRRSSSSWRAVSWIAILCMVTSAGALATTYWNHEVYALITVMGVVATLVATGIFGQAEVLLLSNSLRAAGASLWKRSNREDLSSELRVRLQGTRNWDQVFEQVRASAELLGFASVRLDVNLPFLHEGYHAAWQRKEPVRRDYVWQVVLPLLVGSKSIGRVELSGDRQMDAEIHAWLAQIAELLESIEGRMMELLLDTSLPASDRRAAPISSDSVASLAGDRATV